MVVRNSNGSLKMAVLLNDVLEYIVNAFQNLENGLYSLLIVNPSHASEIIDSVRKTFTKVKLLAKVFKLL